MGGDETLGKEALSLRGMNAYLRDVGGLGQMQRGAELGRDERTIRRWDRDDRDSTNHRPTTPLQQKAWGMCRHGDHVWMTPEGESKRYRDQAFSEEVVCESTGEGDMWRHTTKCYFCGHLEEWFLSESDEMMLEGFCGLPMPINEKGVTGI